MDDTPSFPHPSPKRNTVQAFAGYTAGTIMVDVVMDVEGREYMLSRDILNLKEQVVRDALIAMGWTPPKED